MSVPPSPDSGPSTLSGHLDLVAAGDANGRTILSRQSFSAPFHLSKPHWTGEVLHVQVVNATAGILAGDELDLSVRVESGAALAMSTPSAARAFMMKHAGRAVCRQRLEVGAGGWLEYAPEPLYPHRDTNYDQRTTLEVAAGGEACFTESFSPGRAGLGELWAWRRLALHLDVRIAGRPALRERLDASGEEIGRMAAFHGRDEAWFSTTVVVSSRAAQDGTLWNRVRDLHRDGTWVGATRLHDTMWVVRAVARGGLALRDFQSELRELLAVAIPAHCCDLRKL